MAEQQVDPYDVGDYTAPEGQIWVCGACGKRSRTKYGFNDESCMMNAVLCHDPPEMKDGRPEWKAVEVNSPMLEKWKKEQQEA